ncbi:hypothetical protein C3L33_15914, partial [Rhododendron williamsianum]
MAIPLHRHRISTATTQYAANGPRQTTAGGLGESNNNSFNKSNSSELWLYNTMSKQKEVFRPKVAGKVGMYVCGVTAYDLSHIGHARVYVCFDVLYRYLRHLGYEVNYVRNFTDVDDKIIARARELGEDPISLSRRYCEEFRRDMVYLNCLSPSVEPRTLAFLEKALGTVALVLSPGAGGHWVKPTFEFCLGKLEKKDLRLVYEALAFNILDNGSAYNIDGDVYFSVDKFSDYGQLSGRKLEDNRAGERVAVDSRKKNPADFALWKSAKEGEPFWESPWGPGRPGWHIECSAMSAAYLGYFFDIHGGGMDLIFPHHENEIAQSCAACKKSNVSYWIHNGFVTIDSEKMSKSLGNFFTIRQGKKQELRIESLAALEKAIKKVLSILGLMPTSYSENGLKAAEGLGFTTKIVWIKDLVNQVIVDAYMSKADVCTVSFKSSRGAGRRGVARGVDGGGEGQRMWWPGELPEAVV